MIDMSVRGLILLCLAIFCLVAACQFGQEAATRANGQSLGDSHSSTATTITPAAMATPTASKIAAVPTVPVQTAASLPTPVATATPTFTPPPTAPGPTATRKPTVAPLTVVAIGQIELPTWLTDPNAAVLIDILCPDMYCSDDRVVAVINVSTGERYDLAPGDTFHWLSWGIDL
jgi:hypothetical protein